MLRYIIEIDGTDDGIALSEIDAILTTIRDRFRSDGLEDAGTFRHGDHVIAWREETGPDGTIDFRIGQRVLVWDESNQEEFPGVIESADDVNWWIREATGDLTGPWRHEDLRLGNR